MNETVTIEGRAVFIVVAIIIIVVGLVIRADVDCALSDSIAL